MYIKNFKKTIEILNINEKVKLLIIFILSFVNSAIETIGVGAVLPLITAVYDFELLSNYKFIEDLVIFFMGSFSETNTIKFFLLFLISLFLFKAIFQIYFNKLKINVMTDVATRLQSNLLSSYFIKNWEFHLKNNSSFLIRKISGEVSQFKNKILNSYLEILTELILFIGIYLLLMIVQPKISIILLIIFLVFGYIFLRIYKIKINKLGTLRLEFSGVTTKSLIEIFSMIKEIFIYDKKKFFSNSFDEKNRKYANIDKQLSMISIYPKIIFEFIGIMVLTIITYYLLITGIDKQNIIAILGLYIAALVKILPCVVKIVSSFNKYKSAVPSFSSFYKDYINKDYSKIKKNFISSFNKKIEFRNLDFSYDNKNKIIKNLNFEINKGDKIGIIGKSGVGKSTFLDIFLGLLKPTKGSVLIDGKSVDKINWGEKLGYLGQNINLIDDTLINNIFFGRKSNKNNLTLVKEIIKKCELKELYKKLSNRSNKKIGEKSLKISGGEKQRIGLARSLLSKPDILILDEPTSSLDDRTEKYIIKLLKNNFSNQTMIIISHKKSNLDFCNKIFLLKNGKFLKKL